MPFVDEMVGELVAHLWQGTPQIDLVVKSFEASSTPWSASNLHEAHQAVAELLQLVDVAQHAMWTPELLADVREHYLPGATDAEIIARLTWLAGLELISPGRLFPQDGRALTAAAHRERLDRVAAAHADAGWRRQR